MLRSIDTCQNKVSADPYHVTISRAQVYSSSRSRVFLKLTADRVSDWIAGSYQVNLLKTGQDCSETRNCKGPHTINAANVGST